MLTGAGKCGINFSSSIGGEEGLTGEDFFVCYVRGFGMLEDDMDR